MPSRTVLVPATQATSPGGATPSPRQPSTESAPPRHTGRPAGRPRPRRRRGRQGPGRRRGQHRRQGRQARCSSPPWRRGHRRRPRRRHDLVEPRPRLEPVAAEAARGARVGRGLAGQPPEQPVLGAEQPARASRRLRRGARQAQIHGQQVAAVDPLAGEPVEPLAAETGAQRLAFGLGAPVLPGDRRRDRLAVVVGRPRAWGSCPTGRWPPSARAARRRRAAPRRPPRPPPTSRRATARRRPARGARWVAGVGAGGDFAARAHRHGFQARRAQVEPDEQAVARHGLTAASLAASSPASRSLHRRLTRRSPRSAARGCRTPRPPCRRSSWSGRCRTWRGRRPSR